MSGAAIAQTVRSYIQRELMVGEAREVQDDSPLLEWGVIESLKMVALLSFLEREYQVVIPETEHVPENFQDVAALTRLVERLQAGAAR